MNKIFTHIVIQNQRQNTKYLIINDVTVNHKRYFDLENCKTYEHKTIRIYPHVGRKRILISEEILSGIDISNKFIVSKIFGDVILIEDKF